MPGRRSTTTIRRSLLSSLVLLVALTAGTIGVASLLAGQRTVEDLSRALIDPTARRVSAELNRFFGDVDEQVRVARGWAQRIGLDASQVDRLNDLFVPMLEAHPQVSSMMVADSDGVEYLLLRDAMEPSVWVNRLVRADEWGTRVLNRSWDTRTGQTEESWGELDYDPRRRIWYTEALGTTADDPVFWTAPVIFFITKDPGVTASTHLGRKEVARGTGGPGPETVVVAFDLLLLDISRFTTTLEVSENGLAFVLVERAGERGLRVVGLPPGERFTDERVLREALMVMPPESAVVDSDASLPDPTQIGSPEVEAAVRAWEASERPAGAFGFEGPDGAWLAGFEPYRVGRNTFWIGVALPERDLLAGVRRHQLFLLGTVALIVVVGVLRAVWLSRRFGEPVESLLAETERMRAGDLETESGVESNIKEFRQLAEAHDAMREGLLARITLEKVERDLDIARDIQRGLLPDEPPDTPGFLVEGWSRPADQTGGDFYDWIGVPGGKTLVTLADVTGHGIGPALIVAVCRAYIRAAALGPEQALTRTVDRVNGLLMMDMTPGRFVTTVVTLLDPEACTAHMVSAGHAPLLFYHAATGELESWDADTLPLGILKDLECGEPRGLRFEPGDTLVLLTDGFFEWLDPDREVYGFERLNAFVRANAARPPREIIEGLYEDVLRHARGTEQADDLTVVVIQRARA